VGKRSVPTFASTRLMVGTALARLCSPYNSHPNKKAALDGAAFEIR
jgi:hypothetical protein